MDELLEVISKDFLWIDYGNIEGFIPQENIGLESLIRLKAAVDVAIHRKLEEEKDS